MGRGGQLIPALSATHFIDELHPNKSYLCGGRGQRGVSPASGLRKASLLPLVMGGDGCLPRLRRDCSGAPACFRGRLERVGQESGSRESVLGLRLSLETAGCSPQESQPRPVSGAQPPLWFVRSRARCPGLQLLQARCFHSRTISLFVSLLRSCVCRGFWWHSCWFA